MKKSKKTPIDRPSYKSLLSTYCPFLIIIIIGFVLYWQTLSFDYTYLDDHELILNNLNVLTNIKNLAMLFKEDVFFSYNDAYYRPLLTASFMLDAQWNGALTYFHLTNIIIHIFNSCLILILLLQFGYRRDFAIIAALLFTIHPVLTQAVAWIPGRNDSLLTTFILLSFIFYISYLNNKTIKTYSLHLLFYMCALFTKETALFFVLICLAYILFILRQRIISRVNFVLFIGWTLTSLFWLSLRHIAMQHPLNMGAQEVFVSSIKNSPALIQFVGKIFLPFNLSTLPTIQDTSFIFGILSILCIFLLLNFAAKEKKYNIIVFGISWFLLFLIPSFIRPNPNVIADFIEHRVYLPFIGIYFILAEVDFIKKFNLKKPLQLTFTIILLGTFSVITFIHSKNFKNRLSFWYDAAKHSEHHPLAQRNLGAMFFLDGQFDNAEIQFKKSLSLNPFEPMANMNLGLIYMNHNQFVKAESLFVREIEINPNYENAYFNLGILYYKMGKKDLAEKMWLKTIELHPNFISAYLNLAVLYYEENQISKARGCLKALKQRGASIPQELLKVIGLP